MSLIFIGCRSELNQLLDSSNLKLSKKQKRDYIKAWIKLLTERIETQ